VALTAKYLAPCGVCSSMISPGEEISTVAGRWVHLSCLTEPTRITEVTPAVLAHFGVDLPPSMRVATFTHAS